jgi:hypothetical protein
MGIQRNSQAALVRVVELAVVKGGAFLWVQPHPRSTETGKTYPLRVDPDCPNFIRSLLLVHANGQKSFGQKPFVSPYFAMISRQAGVPVRGHWEGKIFTAPRQNCLPPCRASPRDEFKLSPAL